MKYPPVSEIREAYTAHDANRWLKEGFTLLDVVVRGREVPSVFNPSPGGTMLLEDVVYVLGKVHA